MLIINPTEQPMATITAADMLARLEALGSSLASNRLVLQTAALAVMSPDAAGDKSEANTTLKSAAFPEDGWTGEGSATLTSATGDIKSDDGAMALFSEAIYQALEDIREGDTAAAKQRVKDIVHPLCAALQSSVTEIRTLAGEAKSLLAAPGAPPATALRVAGATGVNEKTARVTWDTSRGAIRSLWVQMRMAKERKVRYLNQLSTDDTASKDEKSEWRASVKDQDQLHDSLLVDLYSVYSGDGEAVDRDSESYKAFTVPKHLDDGQYEEFKQSYITWRALPATIKKYYLILHDLDYVYDAVDAVEAMHLLPPDRADEWAEPALSAMASPVSAEITGHLEEAITLQWRTLYRELYKGSSDKIKTWSTIIHAIGQQANVMVEIKEGQGMQFMYALLGAHVKFTATDQQSHTTILMGMHELFADGGSPNPITAVETARLQLRKASEVGVVPSYDMCGRDLLRALGQLSTDVFNELNKKKLLDPEVLLHSSFNRWDCSTVIQTALTAALTLLQQTAKLKDKQHTGKRKASEAGAEIGALKADVGVSKKQGARIARCVDASIKAHREIRKRKNDLLDYAEANYAKLTNVSELELQVEACALTLTNGQQLQEPHLRRHIKKLQNDQSWRRVHTKGAQQVKDQQKLACMVDGCGRECAINVKTQRSFKICKSCNDELADGKTLTAKDGRLLSRERPRKVSRTETSNRQGDRRVTFARKADVPESSESLSVTLTDDSGTVTEHLLDAKTVELLEKAKQQHMTLAQKNETTMEEKMSFLTQQ